MPTISVEEAVAEIKAGKMVIVVDDEDRENEGDLVMAAEKATPQAVNFMITHGSGIVCAPLTAERLRELKIPMMVKANTAPLATAFTVSVDLLDGTTTGVSAADRTNTIRALIDPETQPDELGRPGHIFPLRYVEGGVLVRAGHTEATVDLVVMAGLSPGGALCEVMAEDGEMARRSELEALSSKHDIGIVTIADIIAYRRGNVRLVERVAEADRQRGLYA